MESAKMGFFWAFFGKKYVKTLLKINFILMWFRLPDLSQNAF